MSYFPVVALILIACSLRAMERAGCYQEMLKANAAILKDSIAEKVGPFSIAIDPLKKLICEKCIADPVATKLFERFATLPISLREYISFLYRKKYAFPLMRIFKSVFKPQEIPLSGRRTVSRDGQYFFLSENGETRILLVKKRLLEFAKLPGIFLGVSSDGRYFLLSRSHSIELYGLPDLILLNSVNQSYDELKDMLCLAGSEIHIFKGLRTFYNRYNISYRNTEILNPSGIEGIAKLRLLFDNIKESFRGKITYWLDDKFRLHGEIAESDAASRADSKNLELLDWVYSYIFYRSAMQNQSVLDLDLYSVLDPYLDTFKIPIRPLPHPALPISEQQERNLIDWFRDHGDKIFLEPLVRGMWRGRSIIFDDFSAFNRFVVFRTKCQYGSVIIILDLTKMPDGGVTLLGGPEILCPAAGIFYESWISHAKISPCGNLLLSVKKSGCYSYAIGDITVRLFEVATGNSIVLMHGSVQDDIRSTYLKKKFLLSIVDLMRKVRVFIL